MPLRITELSRLREMCRSGEARTLRLTAGVSLSELAKDIAENLPATTLHRWETAQRMPRGDQAAGYWRALRRLQNAIDARSEVG